MTSIIAYTYEADTHCPDCAHQRFGVALDIPFPSPVDREGNPVGVIFSWHDLAADYEDGLYCGDCHTCLYLPWDLEPLSDPTIFVPSDDALRTITDYHGALSSYSYAIASTGTLTIDRAPKTARQAARILGDLYAELSDVMHAGRFGNPGPKLDAHEFNRLSDARYEVELACRQYRGY